MLKELNIVNVALMENLHVSLTSGFNVFTGETGAGKSNLIDGIGLILGLRASGDYIRTGAFEAIVEALFDISRNDQVGKKLLDNGLSPHKELLISRVISRKGKNTCRINGRLVTSAILSDIASELVEMQGQHEEQKLFNSTTHLDILDEFCGREVIFLREEVSKGYRDLKVIKGKLKTLKDLEKERNRKLDFLKFEINEIEEARLVIGEEDELSKEKIFLSSIEKINQTLSEIFQLQEQDMGLDYSLDIILKSLQEVSSMDEKIRKFQGRFENIHYEFQDFFSELNKYKEGLYVDPGRLDEIIKRLTIINRLKSKYGNTIEEIILYLEDAKKEFHNLSESEVKIQELEKKQEKLIRELSEKMKNLSHKRKKKASRLEKSVKKELGDIGMEKSEFKVQLRNEDIPAENRINQTGIDEIEFLFSANKGEPLKQLARIASGGEMSRVMLALKSALADVKFIPSLVFDEVDSGLGGEAASKIGAKLLSLSRSYQIICVTHLPQIASVAESHFLIYKREKEGRAVSEMKELSSEERINEISRMLEGDRKSEVSRALAVQMLGM